jgi:K+-dependent Na+/Ca+ exchanger-like protein
MIQTFCRTIVILLSVYIHGIDSVKENDCNQEVVDKDVPEWIWNGGIILILFGLIISFCGMAIVCEEYFVPALNVFCDDLKIPDDVAGATIMSMGNSAPEFFASIISIFVTKTALGLGTALGSAIFNHLCICGASVIYASPNGLALDHRIFLRDYLFYMLSLALLVWALKGSFLFTLYELTVQKYQNECLDVTWRQSLVMCIAFVTYVLLCTYFRGITDSVGGFCSGCAKALVNAKSSVCCGCDKEDNEEEWGDVVENIDASLLLGIVDSEEGVSIRTPNRRLRQLSGAGMELREVPSPDAGSRFEVYEYDDDRGMPSVTYGRVNEPPPSPVALMQNVTLHVSEEDTEPLHDLPSSHRTSPYSQLSADDICDSENNALSHNSNNLPNSRSGITTYQCWLYRKNYSYSTIRRLTGQHWQLRYFVMDISGLRYYRERKSIYNCCNINGNHNSQRKIVLETRVVNIYNAIAVEITSRDLFEFAIVYPRDKIYLRASCVNDFDNMYSRLTTEIALYQNYSDNERKALFEASKSRIYNTQSSRVVVEGREGRWMQGDAIEILVPNSAHFLLRIVKNMLYPIKFILSATIPEACDPRTSHVAGETDISASSRLLPAYVYSLLACIFYLVILTFLMIYCLEIMGKVCRISSGVMGLVFAAAGTSFPNLVSSVIVAKMGQGNMAISNAFGSNIFCLLFGLGFPWLIYNMSHHGAPYDGLQDNGLILSIFVLIVINLVFLLLLFCSQFVLRYYLGILCFCVYGAFVCFAIYVG